MAVHFKVIADRVEERFNVLFDQLLADGDILEKPPIRVDKRPYARGRSKDRYVISTGITVAPIIASDEGGVSSREDIAYRFMVSLGSGTYTDTLEDDWPVATWEQAIRQRYQQQRIGLTGIDGCEIACTVKPGKLPDWAELEESVDATFLELSVWVRESRRED